MSGYERLPLLSGEKGQNDLTNRTKNGVVSILFISIFLLGFICYLTSTPSLNQDNSSFSLSKLLNSGISKFNYVFSNDDYDEYDEDWIETTTTEEDTTDTTDDVQSASEEDEDADGCLCNGENMCFQPYLNGKPTEPKGKPFDCQLLQYLKKFNLTDDSKLEDVHSFDPNEVVFVTYASGNHFSESRLAIKHIRKIMNNTIAFYDIGLNEKQAEEIKAVCNVEYHKINYEDYPSHMRNLHTYQFKTLVDSDAFTRYPVYWMIDASIRFSHKDDLDKFYCSQMNSSLELHQMRLYSGHSIYHATQPRMYEYLPIDKEFSQSNRMIKSGIQFVRRSSFARENLKWFLLCALDRNCMAPRGHQKTCPNYPRDPWKAYGHCHRYDQSALDIINSNLLERDGIRKERVAEWSKFIRVERGTEYHRPLNIPCQ